MNLSWAQELEANTAVLGQWPTFLMHYLDAEAEGIPFPEAADLTEHGRGLYLYDRGAIYRSRHSTLWNVAMPGAITRSCAFYLKAHMERFQAFAPDAIVICVGSVDCLEHRMIRTTADMSEPGPISAMAEGQTITFEPCQSADEFESALTSISEMLPLIRADARIVHLDIIRSRNRSRSLNAKLKSFSQVIHGVSAQFGHRLVTHPYLDEATEAGIDQWLRTDDGHPTEAMNSQLAMQILHHLLDMTPAAGSNTDFPVETIDIADWSGRSKQCN
ncbi:SGNH/GDSL hydrolase family protein [Roseibium suaedae]|uniref:SGNH/GDSL hydrolase family protein n=1 Tax=Roseibium suaedae TaxID=735517 RepID=UPI001114CC0E|nr:SGNH/GDSL hydrolase family protein [Roseibium suaedae]